MGDFPSPEMLPFSKIGISLVQSSLKTVWVLYSPTVLQQGALQLDCWERSHLLFVTFLLPKSLLISPLCRALDVPCKSPLFWGPEARVWFLVWVNHRFTQWCNEIFSFSVFFAAFYAAPNTCFPAEQ